MLQWRKRGFVRAGLISISMAAMAASGPVRAADYPYDLNAISIELGIPVERFEVWWSKAPEKLRSKLEGSELNRWGSIVICDYLGFRVGTQEGETCAQDRYEKRMATADQWGPNGEYVGPSQECIARNKTDKWGRLICE